ncbi:MAG: ribonuclease R [Desulfobulbaceae bacterium A2]|nr:MAG: ribonuclease R [Desulfobulbaceae bacterium A2]
MRSRKTSGRNALPQHRRPRSQSLPPPAEATHLRDRLLADIAGQEEPRELGQLLADLELPRSERGPLKRLLNELVDQGQLQLHKKRYLPASGDNGLLQATVSFSPRGYAFALMDGITRPGQDPFITPQGLAGAQHNDQVLVRLEPSRSGRSEARVVRILQRGTTSLCGIFTSGGRSGWVLPDDERLPFSVLIRKGNSLNAPNGSAVQVEIITYPATPGGQAEGKVLRVLGDPNLPAVQFLLSILRFSLQEHYPQAVLAEVDRLVPLVAPEPGRKDLRQLPHVTIDGESARDFDDAIAVIAEDDGFTLHVSIADVSHYVRPGSQLDQEAYLRGTSVYLPDRVLPMLPERLSNDLCSLVPHQDRPTLTCTIRFDRSGGRRAIELCRSMIHSRHRLTYNQVHGLLSGQSTPPPELEDIMPMLQAAGHLADLLNHRRLGRGSIGFTLPEPEIQLNAEGIITDIRRRERNPAHQLIEEFMLAANEAVAETLDRRGLPFLFRIHERPDPLKVAAFSESAAALGLRLPPPTPSPEPVWFAKVLHAAASGPTAYVVNNLMLRTMQQARYAPENKGHFGLAATWYTHFTSPIRRYPDLMVHRALTAMFAAEAADTAQGHLPLSEAGTFLSRRERISVEVERDVQARCAALFMQERIGEEFAAVISGISSFALFVELTDYFVSGALLVQDLPRDNYQHDPTSHKLYGLQRGTSWHLGDLVRVRLVKVDQQSRRLNFCLADE